MYTCIDEPAEEDLYISRAGFVTREFRCAIVAFYTRKELHTRYYISASSSRVIIDPDPSHRRFLHNYFHLGLSVNPHLTR